MQVADSGLLAAIYPTSRLSDESVYKFIGIFVENIDNFSSIYTILWYTAYVMLYILSKIESLNNDFIEQTLPLLSKERLAKVTSIRDPRSKILSAAVYLLLRFALYEEYGINTSVEFDHNKNGKPELRDHPHIKFNLSHCRNAAACVISDEETGVDIQDIRSVSDRVAKRVLTAEEYAGYLASGSPDESFCELWAIKECRMKQLGTGISSELSELSADDVQDKTLFKGENYICCVSGIDTRVRYVGVQELYDFILALH